MSGLIFLLKTVLFAAALGSGDGVQATATNPQLFPETMRNFGRCAAERFRKRSLSLLDQEPGSAREREIVIILGSNSADCLRDGDMISFTTPVLRGSVAEGLYFRDFPDGVQLSALASAPLRPRTFKAPDRNAEPSRRRANAYLHGFADCVVAAQPQKVHVVVESAPLSPAEDAAFAELGTVLSICLPEAENIQLQVAVLRAALAEALYLRARTETGRGGVD